MLDLVPFRRRHEFPEVFKEMEDMFKDFWHDFALGEIGTDLDVNWAPRLDVIETEGTIEIKAELPGLERKDIDISLDGNVLVIKGEKKLEKEETDKHYHRKERRYGSFYRALRLPAEVVSDKINATYKDGLLTITLPKTEESKKRIAHIEVH